MIVSTPSFLRGVIALSSTLLTVLSGVAIYECVFAVLLLAKSLPLDGYVWVDILGMAGSGKPEKHVVNLRLGGECEVAVWVAAGCGIGAGVMGVVRALFEERQRWRGVGKDYHQLSVSRKLKSLRYVACISAVIALVGSAVSAVYLTLHSTAVRRSTCHWTMGEHHDATLKCTRELAICEVSPYLVKPNRSEQAVGWRQKACGQLQHSRKSLVFLALLSLVIVVGYGAQAYLARREEKMLLSVEEKTVSVRSSSDSQNRSPRSSWGSSDSQRIEKAE
ncbi:hypothetical protein HBI56_161790 [Parastagonospora nodorum]|nr:hypothetical protein HBI10_186540 [Parastagonospora nodorum]KAH4014313.1 hypothetical protein HBI13_172470 [Parastagonospora nodorum]KAH4022517.1 hypothetical protein HBI09_170560 [Parastagonospora nodorum]KAH4171541.1 hypothetical protein HBH43_100320 [Parastagonospora nodorum]KAH4206813.1 hypothetical protein HBI95_120910 [Parastagonospora nodorum]